MLPGGGRGSQVAKTRAARQYLYHCAWRVTQGRDVVQDVSLLKALTGELVNEPWMHTYTDVKLGVNMQTGRPKYDVTKWMFTNVDDRRKYTQADPFKDKKPA